MTATNKSAVSASHHNKRTEMGKLKQCIDCLCELPAIVLTCRHILFSCTLSRYGRCDSSSRCPAPPFSSLAVVARNSLPSVLTEAAHQGHKRYHNGPNKLSDASRLQEGLDGRSCAHTHTQDRRSRAACLSLFIGVDDSRPIDDGKGMCLAEGARGVLASHCGHPIFFFISFCSLSLICLRQRSSTRKQQQQQ